MSRNQNQIENPIDWLKKNILELADAREGELFQATIFPFLWSCLELHMLNKAANPKSIHNAVQRIPRDRNINLSVIRRAAVHFKNRYFYNGQPNKALDLLFERSGGRSVVEKFFRKEKPTQSETICAILLIIYRLRNNFLHGPKMSYGLEGQQENFEFANSVIMELLDMGHKEIRI